MRTFTLDTDNNIEMHASQTAAKSGTGNIHAFSTAAGLARILRQRPGSAVKIWNSLTGVKRVRKFTDAATAAKRILAELHKLEAPAEQVAPASAVEIIHEEAPFTRIVEPKPKVTTKKIADTMAPKAAKAASAAGNLPRKGSKTAQLIEMLKSPGGATLEEVMTRFGWQVHTTRALMSAGGALTRKYRLTVISEKIGDARTYRIAKA